MAESPVEIFERLADGAPPTDAPKLFGTAAVLGGSVAGLLAARVLADYARTVVIVERDDTEPAGTRPGAPHAHQIHLLLPGGRKVIERWLPGITAEIMARGAGLATPATTATTLDGRRQADSGADHRLLAASRNLLETTIRRRVLDLPNVSLVRGLARGLRYRDGAVTAVLVSRDGTTRDGTAPDEPHEGSVPPGVGASHGGGFGEVGKAEISRPEGGSGTAGDVEVEAGFVVDAMGRSSRLRDWLGRDGYDQPPMERLVAPINYATAMFRREDDDPEIVAAVAYNSLGNELEGVAVAAASAIEDGQWLVGVMGYDDAWPGRTEDEMRKIGAVLPPVYARATAGDVTRDVATFHQADSRRRDYTAVRNFPAGLVAVGDAVASYNPIYGQGMSSAALHASALAEYLANFRPGVAWDFFALQKVVTDAAWTVSAGSDEARIDALAGTEVPPEVRAQREAMQTFMASTLTDPDAAHRFNDVSYMLRHPATLG